MRAALEKSMMNVGIQEQNDFEIRRFCLLAGDGALLAAVRIAVPVGCDLSVSDPTSAEKNKNSEKGKKNPKEHSTKKEKRRKSSLTEEEKIVKMHDIFRSYSLAVSSACHKYARETLFESVMHEYDKDPDPKKRYRFNKYVYSVEFRIIAENGERMSVLAHSRLSRGGKTLASGIEGAVITPGGILPPKYAAGIRGTKALRSSSKNGGILLTDCDGSPVIFTLTHNGEITSFKPNLQTVHKKQAKSEGEL